MTGLGDTTPRFAPGELPDRPGPTVAPVTVTLGGRTLTPAYAGVTPGNAGLYQVSFVLDEGTPSGDLDLRVTVGNRRRRNLHSARRLPLGRVTRRSRSGPKAFPRAGESRASEAHEPIALTA